ncbi:MAG: SGNH/GDSL hydrolase family protein [Ferruginibacter sp.]
MLKGLRLTGGFQIVASVLQLWSVKTPTTAANPGWWVHQPGSIWNAPKLSVIIILMLNGFFLHINKLHAQTPFEYHDAKEFLIIGRGFQNTGYTRLPLEYKQKIRPDVWNLSQHSSGIAIRFTSNSSVIDLKWKTGKNSPYPHVAETLVKGVDLYCMQDGKWFYAGVGKPYDEEYNQATIVRGMDSTMKDFMLYLPMYQTVDSIFIGVEPGALVNKPGESGFRNLKPIVFYGTSITQGAAAMRSGMAYTSLIERHLNIETINLGFSGNGILEKELGDIMGEISASCYVIDCGGNLSPRLAIERTIPFINNLRQKAPGVPILLVGHLLFPHGRFNRIVGQSIDSINQAFKNAFVTLKKGGMKDIYYLPAENLIGTDGEATVDGTHLTDLGFTRIAGEMEKQLKKILKL